LRIEGGIVLQCRLHLAFATTRILQEATAASAMETEMWRPTAGVAIAIAAIPCLASSGVAAAEKFQKLTGAQIRAKVAGMEITDESHWDVVYGRNGSLTSYSMGNKSAGKWSVRNDQLCIELGKDDPGGGCYEVWLSGNKVELRQKNIEEPLEGVLQKPPSNR
jgi:hypothetical protein